MPWHDGVETESGQTGRRSASRQPSVRKVQNASVTVVGIVTQIAWAVALGYPLVLLAINITRFLAQL